MAAVTGFIDFTVTGISCTPPSGAQRAECCANRIGATASSFAYSFCMAICVLCCMVCEISFKYNFDESAPGGVEDPEPNAEPIPSYPVVVPKPGGFSFTASSYGIGLPIVFGSDRLTGNVFWMDDFTNHKFKSKGQQYYYTTVSFAVGICEGTITGLVRLWLGDKLIIDNSATVDVNNILQPRSNGFLTGASVDFTDHKSPLRNLASSKRTTRISVFNGNEKQLPQGVMVAEEGYDNVPGYRGVAYILFENFIVTDSTIPEISVEVTANTSTLFPRLYGDYDEPTASPTLDRAMPNAILVDPSYDQIIVPSTSSSTSDEGLARFDANNLDAFDSYDLEGTTFAGNTLGTANWDSLQILSSGLVAFMENEGNSGVLWVYNPFTGSFTDIMGPGGGLFGHDADGFGATNVSTCVLQNAPPNNVPMDVYFGVGQLNNSWGAAYINKDGQIVDFEWDNGVITGDFNRCVTTYVDATIAADHPTFVDGSSTNGTHVFVFGSPGATEGFSTQLHVHRITFHRISTTDTTALTNYSFDTILCDDMGGAGFDHIIKHAFLDPIDGTFVLLMRIASRSDRILKYSPYTGAILWSTAVTEFKTGDFQAAPIATIGGRTFVWYDTNNILHEIDLDTGEVTELFDMDAQSLPAPRGEIGFYHSYEDCYYYTANATDKRLNKVFLRKIQRSTVDLADVVTNLLQRIGVSPSDINTDDVTGLSLLGYTISQPMTLRAVFSELAQAFKYDLVESNGTFLYKTRGSSSGITIPHTALADVDAHGWLKESAENDIARTRKIALTYRDIDRDYGDNVQAISLPDYVNLELDNDTPIEVKVPVVLEAVDARKLAEVLLFSKLVYNSTYEFSLSPKYKYLDPGDVVTVTREDPTLDDAVLRLRSVDQGADHTVKITASKEDPDIHNDTVEIFGNIGRFERGEIPPVSPRVDPYLLAIPGRSDDEIAAANSSYTVYFALLNTRVTTPPVNDVGVVIDGDQSYTFDPPASYPTWGYVTEPLDLVLNFYSTDESSMTIRLINEGQFPLASAADKDTMLADGKVNLAIVGQELVQFRDVVDNGNGTYTLSHFHRVLHGTEQYVGSHVIGEKFILLGNELGVLDEQGIIQLDIAKSGSPRKIIQINAHSGNPFQPPFVEFYITTNLRPFSPSGVSMEYVSGDMVLEWQYRARYNADLSTFNWSDVPHSEAANYTYYLFTDPTTLNLFDPTTYLRAGTTTSNTLTYTDAQQTADGFDRTTETLYFLVHITSGATAEDVGGGIQVNHPPLTS